MGLDMFAYAVDPKGLGNKQTDVELPEEKNEFFYWRKHPNLHGWMHDLYKRKGGAMPDFNCDNVRLDLDDLDELERDMHSLPETEGFFFGQSTPEDTERDKEFIAKARELIAEGMAVFYTSWW
jgi:hypothetical protein